MKVRMGLHQRINKSISEGYVFADDMNGAIEEAFVEHSLLLPSRMIDEPMNLECP